MRNDGISVPMLGEPSRGTGSLLSLQGLAFCVVVLAIATLPFEISKTWFPATWMEVSRAFMVLGILLTTIVAVRSRTGIPPDGLIVATAGLAAVGAISVALHPTADGVKSLAAIVLYFGFALTVAWNVRTTERLRIVAATVVVSMVVVGAIAMLGQALDVNLWRDTGFGIIDRRNSTLADPNVTARLLLIGYVALIAIAVSSPTSRRLTVLAVGGALVMGAAVALMQSRTIWVLSGAVVVLITATLVRRRPDFLVVAAFVGALALSILAVPATSARVGTMEPGGAGAMATDPALPEGGVSLGPSTPVDSALAALPLDGIRRYLIRAGIAMWIDHPLQGVGIGGFDAAMRGPYWAFVPPDRRSEPVTLSHTEIVRVAAETGLAGLVAWCVFVFAFAHRSLRVARTPHGRVVGTALLTAFLVILAASQFAGRFTNEPYLWVTLGLVSAAPWIVVSRRAAPDRIRLAGHSS